MWRHPIAYGEVEKSKTDSFLGSSARAYPNDILRIPYGTCYLVLVHSLLNFLPHASKSLNTHGCGDYQLLTSQSELISSWSTDLEWWN
jgi:hypothetical protein